jgi:hypothetical protein
MKKQLLFVHLFTLLISGLIYLAFRADTLLMFKWFASVSLDTPIEYLREMTLTTKNKLPEWFLFSLPDGLWIFSYITLTLLIWKNKVTKQNFFWVFIIPLTAILSEFGQLIKIVPGTFDLFDLTFYFLGAVAPILIFTNLLTFNTKTT